LNAREARLTDRDPLASLLGIVMAIETVLLQAQAVAQTARFHRLIDFARAVL
jgi:hypothetical protein